MLRRVGILFVLCLATAIIMSACGDSKQEATYEPVLQGIDVASFDTTCKPCDDLYQYVNGTWLANNPVPAEYGSWGMFYQIYENNNKVLKQILEDAAAHPAQDGTIHRKIGDFFYAAMDSAGTETAGLDPLRSTLAEIDAIANLQDLHRVISELHAEGLTFAFDIDGELDVTNSSQYILYVSQGGLGLPDRDYYTRDDEESVTLRNQYVDHMATMFGLLGDDAAHAKEEADDVMAIETRLAKASLTNVEYRDPSTWYDWKTVEEANEIIPNFPWDEYLAAIGHPEIEAFSMTPEKFFVELNKLMQEMPLDSWKAYLRWHLIDNLAQYLSSEFVNADFAFNGTILNGTKELRPRWKRALSKVNTYLGEGLGQLYVEKTFPPESKQRALEMVKNLKAAFRKRLADRPWMSEETRAKAIAKLDAFGQKIGYPDKWRDYSSLKIDRGPYVENIRRARAFDKQYELNKIGKPIDETEWGMNAQAVNAYYHPIRNEIVFPAGILQPPFFDGQADDAVNYGAMGIVIGHEMTHGFDDMGSRFDADGNMVDWWTDEDREKFTAATDRLVKQFDEYTVLDSLHVNGKLTLGENIADLGGMRISYEALQIARQGKEDPMIDGFTQNQRFFLSAAQATRENSTPESTKRQVLSDEHTPWPLRMAAAASNLTEFEEAFGCKDTDPAMRPPAERIEIW